MKNNNNLILVSEQPFTIKSRFGNLIGRGLISSSTVAVAELVKNSYDADSTKIVVNFHLESSEKSITFEDNGDGMTFADLTDKWLAVGTDNKIQSPITKKGRRKIGEKGIGRFAVERLGSKTIIETTTYGSEEKYVLIIDWDKLENSNFNFTEYKHQIYKKQCSKEEKGTIIKIINLRDEWTTEEIDELRSQLSFIKPLDFTEVAYFDYNFINDVSIILKVNDIDFNNEINITNEYIKHYEAHIYGEIIDINNAYIFVEILPSISTNRKHIKEKYELTNENINLSCGPVKFDAFIFFKDKRLYNTFDVDSKKVDDFLTENCGIKLYRDGLRVLPFGDSDNDWLELNAKRTSNPEHRVSTKNIIGIVSISKEKNPKLEDVLNRENIKSCIEFDDLKDFINLGFERYAAIQLKNRNQSQKKQQEKGKKIFDNTKSSITALTGKATTIQEELLKTIEIVSDSTNIKDIDVSNTLNTVSKCLTDFAESITESMDDVKSAYNFYRKESEFRNREVQIYRNIATLGITAARFGHETANTCLYAKNICDDLKELVSQIDSINDDFAELYKSIIYINENADFFRSYLKKDHQKVKSQNNIADICNSCINQHKELFAATNITPKINILCNKDELLLNCYEGDFISIFTNIIVNAYKAIKLDPSNTLLEFSFDSNDDTIIIDQFNGGKKIENKDKEHIFEPLFSTHSDGTGLGLTIIVDTLENYNGNIKLIDDNITHFKICIKKN